MKDPPEIIRQKIMPMVTDTRRMRRSDPGEPNDCPVFTLHRAFVPKDKQDEIADGCRTAGIGCRECKAVVLEDLIRELAPIQERRRAFEKDPGRVWDILEDGKPQGPREPPEADDGRGPDARSRTSDAVIHGLDRQMIQEPPGSRAGGRLPGQARDLRRPARPSPFPDQEEEDRHPRHPHRRHHPGISGLSRPEGADQPRPRGRIPADGRPAHLHQVPDAPAPRAADRARHRSAARSSSTASWITRRSRPLAPSSGKRRRRCPRSGSGPP